MICFLSVFFLVLRFGLFCFLVLSWSLGCFSLWAGCLNIVFLFFSFPFWVVCFVLVGLAVCFVLFWLCFALLCVALKPKNSFLFGFVCVWLALFNTSWYLYLGAENGRPRVCFAT